MSEDLEDSVDNGAEPDLMADLAAAWDSAEPDSSDTADTPEASSAPAEAISADTPIGGQDEPETASASQEGGQEAAPAGDSPSAAGDGASPTTAPPAVREAWASLPDSVKTAWNDREQQYRNNIQSNSERAQFATAMMDAAAPYQQALRMEANSPQEAFAAFGQFVTGMRSGTPKEKASALAELVQRYGVGINELDDALAKTFEPSEGKPAPAAAPQEFRDPRVDQMLKQQQLRGAQNANNEIKTFHEGGAEFMNDVRNDMADIMDVYTARGQGITLQEAYDKACAMNPAVQQVMEQRALTSDSAAQKKKRNAASSISGAPNGSGQGSPDTLRGALEQAWGDS